MTGEPVEPVDEEYAGRTLFERFRAHANEEGSRLGVEEWSRQHPKRKRAWMKLADEVNSWL